MAKTATIAVVPVSENIAVVFVPRTGQWEAHCRDTGEIWTYDTYRDLHADCAGRWYPEHARNVWPR